MMDVFSLVAKIMLDTDEYKNALGEASAKTHSFGEKLKSGLATAAKVGAAGLAAATTAVTALSKAALDSYGDYEQLVGGVETLFKNSADIVMSYANNAYQTAGLSANQYMETVTSFSASLLQGLGGDTEAAAKTADLAITDMADNANKLGTSMDMIQNAYQGFAKQNYTMLDNLKLGYGGTQAEMARLINDSGVLGGTMKVTAETVNQVSFDKMIEAIHVVQTEMGITGTTAAEAASTIQGSVSAAKSAWENLITGLGNENADLSNLVTKFTDSVGIAAENVIPRIAQTLSGLGSAIQTLAPVIAEQTPVLVEGIVPFLLNAGVSLVDGLLSGIISALPVLAEVAPDIIEQLLTAIVDNLPALITAALFVVTTLASGISKFLPELIPAIVDIIIKIVETLIENVDELVSAALAIIVALMEGLINAIPKLLGAVPKIITAIVNSFASFGSKFLNVGKDIIRGVWDGIVSMGSWLGDKITGFFGGIVDGVKGFLGIHSPSTVFAAIGGNMALGLGNGWDDKYSDIKRDIEKDFTFENDFAVVNVPKRNILNETTDTAMIKEIRSLKEAILSMKLVLDTGAVAGGVTDKINRNMGDIYTNDIRRKFA